MQSPCGTSTNRIRKTRRQLRRDGPQYVFGNRNVCSSPTPRCQSGVLDISRSAMPAANAARSDRGMEASTNAAIPKMKTERTSAGTHQESQNRLRIKQRSPHTIRHQRQPFVPTTTTGSSRMAASTRIGAPDSTARLTASPWLGGPTSTAPPGASTTATAWKTPSASRVIRTAGYP